jgi:hypothetical protein
VPWIPVGQDEPIELVRAYHQARTYAARLRDALMTAGLGAEEFPGLGATVSANGEPVVLLGRVGAETALRLAQLLHGLPTPPPAERGARAGDGSAGTRAA